MPVVPSCLLEAAWAEFCALLDERRGGEPPQFHPAHPLGCHRRRVPGRVVFEHVVAALVHGNGYERIATAGCSDRTIRRRLGQLLDELGFHGQIARKGVPAPVPAGTRWVVERTQCAARRPVVFPAQPGGIRREVPGSNGLPGSERLRGQQHARKPGGRAQRSGAVRRGDPRDMAKAGLPESQSPVDASSHPPERPLKPVPRSAPDSRVAGAPPERGTTPSEGVEGDEWDAYVTLLRTTGTNAGSPAGREPQGDGGLVVVAGVTPGQGGRESRLQGEGGQVMRHHQIGRHA